MGTLAALGIMLIMVVFMAFIMLVADRKPDGWHLYSKCRACGAVRRHDDIKEPPMVPCRECGNVDRNQFGFVACKYDKKDNFAMWNPFSWKKERIEQEIDSTLWKM